MNGSQTDLGSVSASPKPSVNESAGDTQLRARLMRNSSRIDVDSLMNEFRHELGPSKWEKYRDSLTHFLMGKLSRAELVRCLKENLGLSGPAMRNHNTLVLSLLANACREAPPGTESSLAEWKATTRSGAKARHSQMDSANDRMHKEILSLPVRERRRIKSIVKESMAALKNPILPPPPPVLVATRQAMLPHIPYAQDGRDPRASQSPAGTAGGGPGSTGATPASATASSSGGLNGLGRSAKGKDKDSATGGGQAMLTDPLLNLHPGRTSGPHTWTQDIIQGFDVPLIAESREIPDDFTLGTRMLGTALEQGLLGGIGPGATDIMLLGLETYLSGIVDKLVSLRHRGISGDDPLGASDFNLLADLQPSEMGEISAPLFQLRMNMLQDEETLVPTRAPALEPAEPAGESSAEPSRKRTATSPLDLENFQKVPRTEPDESYTSAVTEHEQGIALLNELLD